MATDGPTPTPCDQEIFEKGELIALLDGSSNAVENWVKEVAEKANARLDWHYTGGVAQVLHLGDMESRRRVERVAVDMPQVENPMVMRRIPADSPGLYRKGVTETPKNAIAAFMDPVSGEQAFI
ncbi:MAG: hypothetical protein UV40_C0018G0004 [Parcubacteria group bacterium GW2011_GWA1_42_7]|nr:MAG: hypothetical protein UV34_C0012G0005 [Parcubacteria group bacterium GW2011_GWB1_42_6]KKS69631.1 MAG: hypothetical protein UV40_C0018G0004 [Parcubacteria group bacterium GW2011_GWA1_42_7]KKS92565.1 MAG: hypothetical protein UV67_C0001G0005 [Parcubacteria group bacterium GW2011_GWC1_43_12]